MKNKWDVLRKKTKFICISMSLISIWNNKILLSNPEKSESNHFLYFFLFWGILMEKTAKNVKNVMTIYNCWPFQLGENEVLMPFCGWS